MNKLFIFLFFLFSAKNVAALDCHPMQFNHDSIVCECDASYCDTVEPAGRLFGETAAVYTTSKAGLRLKKSIAIFRLENQNAIVIELNSRKNFQRILGFGGGFTDATGINISSLSAKLQTELLASYFSRAGIEYSLARVPMASNDFSRHVYSYDDTPNDFDLKFFALSTDDFQYKIPFIKQAMQLSENGITLFASPWSAPAWMKTNNSMMGGSLKENFGDQYAKYFSKFFHEYEKLGIFFWGVTVVNEPTDNVGLIQSMILSADEERDLIKKYLGPELKNNNKNIHLMMLDDDVGFLNKKPNLPDWAETILSDKEAAKYISGIGIHWYFEPKDDLQRLDQTQQLFPKQFILGTEASSGAFIAPLIGPRLGYWEDGIAYANDIIGDLQHNVIGWTDLNLALDMQGGPNWVHNFTDATIIVDASKNVFYKQPTFYIMGHFSRFIPKNSVRMDATVNDARLKIVAFKTPLQNRVVVVMNHNLSPISFSIHDSRYGYLQTTIPAEAIQTYIFK